MAYRAPDGFNDLQWTYMQGAYWIDNYVNGL
jgi:hypothetical protein